MASVGLEPLNLRARAVWRRDATTRHSIGLGGLAESQQLGLGTAVARHCTLRPRRSSSKKKKKKQKKNLSHADLEHSARFDAPPTRHKWTRWTSARL